MYAIDSIGELFETSPVFFLTFKSEKTKHQSINFIDKLCKKLSSTYLIIREKNKVNEGYHFHALFKSVKTPPKRWFIKGVHMHLRQVGRSAVKSKIVYPPPNVISRREIQDAYLEGLINLEVRNDEIMNRHIFPRQLKKLKLRENVDRLLLYMSKEAELPVQYHDYILCVGGKQRVISP